MDNKPLFQLLTSELMAEIREVVRAEFAAANQANTTTPANTKPLSQKELCSFLGISEPTIIRWKKKGKIPFMNIGSAVRYNVNDVLKAIEKKK